MIVRGVLVPVPVCAALAVLARTGARVLAERDAAPLRPEVAAVLDELNRVAVAASMSEAGHVSPADADIDASSDRLGQPRWVTVPAAAGLIHKTDRTVRRLAGLGELVGRKHGNTWMIDRRSIDAYNAAR